MASASQGRQIHVQLTLHDGERSFGMSLAQRSSVLGPKYTVVSSVFANSPADRAGVRKGYVVRYIDDKPMGGLTVAQVANHFRNVAQAKITLEVVEIPGASAFTAVAFGGAIANKVTTQTERPTPPVTGFSTVSSGRAIAAPGSALAVPTVSAPKEAVLRFGAKPTAKMVGSSSETGLDSTKSAPAPRADSKPTRRESQTGLKSNTVTPVLRLGPKPKPVQPEKMTVMTSNVELKPASTCVPTKPSSASAANKQPTTSRIPQSPVQSIESPTEGASAQASEVDVTTQPKQSPTAVVPAKASASVSTAPRQSPEPAPVAKTTTQSAPAKKLTTVPPPMDAKAAAAMLCTSSQSTSRPPLSIKSPVSGTSISTPASTPTAVQPRNVVPAPVVPPPKPAAVSDRRTPPSPVVIPPVPKSARSTSVPSPGSSVNPRSTPSPTAAAAAQAPAGKTGKKRGRPRKNQAAANGTTNNKTKGKGKAKKTQKQQPEAAEVDAIMDDENVFEYFAFSSDSEVDESPSPKRKGRRRGVTDRTRHSLTIDRLLGMGFTREDAEASVKEFGDDPDACMVWIVSRIEERNFTEDLNRASIQSEQSKRDEEKRKKKREKETQAQAEKFMALFPTSYMVCPESTASHLKKFLQSTIDQVNGEAYVRDILSKLLTLEGKAIKWYKEATRSYMLELAGRLDAELGTHSVMTCCARVSASGSCAFVRMVLDELNALKKALFEMSSNQGGVPPVFLACDKTTKFDLDDDGFEVVE